MYKTLCAFLLLLATFAITSASKSVGSSPATLTSPVIVGQLALNRTAPIPTTTFFNVGSSGLYRISAYLAMKVTASGGCPWNFDLGWTDDAGAEGPQQILQLSEGAHPPDSYSFGPTAGYQQTLIVRAVAGTAVTYSVNDTGCPAGGTYELFATAERLQ